MIVVATNEVAGGRVTRTFGIVSGEIGETFTEVIAYDTAVVMKPL